MLAASIALFALLWALPVGEEPQSLVRTLDLQEEGELSEDLGRVVWIDYRADFDGTLHLWAKADFDVYLRAEDLEGQLAGLDDQSAGRSTAYLEIKLQESEQRRIGVIAADPDSVGTIEFHAIPSPEPESLRATATQAATLLGRAAELTKQGEPLAARELVEQAFELLTTAEGPTFNLPCATAMNALVGQARKCGATAIAIRGYEYLLAFLHQTKPPEHPETTRMLGRLALAKKRAGDYAGARVLQEQILELRERELPSTHYLVTTARRELADTLLAIGETKEAKRLFEWVLDDLAHSLSPGDAELLLLQGRLAAVTKALGDVRGARQLEESILAAAEEQLPEFHPGVTAARLNLARSLMTLGELYRASELLEAAVTGLASEYSAAEPELLESESLLARVLAQTGQLERAIELQREVLAVHETELAEANPVRLAAMSDLARSLHAAGELEEARALRETVLARCEEFLPADHADRLRARLDLSISRSALGEWEPARKTQAELLETYRATLAIENPERLRAREALAATLARLGDWSTACAYYRHVREARQRVLPTDHPDLLRARLEVAEASEHLGDWTTALEERDGVLALREARLPEGHPTLLRERQALARDLMEVGRPEAALELQTAVFDAWRRAGAAAIRDQVSARSELAELFLEAGEVVLATQEFEGLLKTLVELEGTHTHETLLVSERLAALQGLRGELGEVIDSMERSLAIRSASLPETHESVLRNTANIALAIHAGGEPGPASYRYSVLRKLLGDRVTAALSRGWSAGRELLEENQPALAAATVLHAGLEPVNYSLYFELLANRQLAKFGQVLHPIERQADEPLRALIADAELLRSRIEGSLRAQANAEERSYAVDDELKQLSERSAASDAKLREALEAKGQLPELITFWPTKRLLPTHGAIVHFQCFPKFDLDRDTGKYIAAGEQLLAVLYESDATVRGIELGSVDELKRLVLDWRKALGVPLAGAGRGSEAASSTSADDPAARLVPGTPIEDPEIAAGRALRSRLLAPILEALGSELEELYLVPDGFLRLVPLDSLPSYGERSGDHLRIVVLPRVPSLEPLPLGPPPLPKLLAVGAIDLNAEGAESAPTEWRAPAAVGATSSLDGVPDLAPLANSPAELQAVLTTYFQCSGVDGAVLSKNQATKSALLSKLGNFNYVHLSAQGWFAPSALEHKAPTGPLTPYLLEPHVEHTPPTDLGVGLALAGTNRGRDERGRVPGILTARELVGAELRGCRLVVVSGFDPELELEASARALETLRSALHQAGAESTLISIWKADPVATRELLQNFYAYHWRDGLTIDRALWKAKFALRLAGYPVRDWAGWMLTGGPWN